MDVLKPWITRRITELLGFEDDIVIDYCISNLTEPSEKGLDPRLLQVNMTGFMERKAAPFCSELWKNLISANASPVGVPQEFIDEKKNELKKKKEEADKVQEELQRRKKELEEDQQSARDRHRARERAREQAEKEKEKTREESRNVPGVLGAGS